MQMVADTTKKTRTHYAPAIIAKAKALYLVKGLGPKDISATLKVPYDSLINWIQRGKWSTERKARLLRLEQAALTRATDENAAFLESVAIQSEDITEDALTMASKHAKSRGQFAARNLQSSTQAVKNMVDVYFRAKGIDGKNTGSTVNIGSIYVNRAPLERELKPVVDLGKVQLPEGKA